jgi:hypothetical protein
MPEPAPDYTYRVTDDKGEVTERPMTPAERYHVDRQAALRAFRDAETPKLEILWDAMRANLDLDVPE